MKTIVLGEHKEVAELIERRRSLGLDGHDEVWDGVYVFVPLAHSNHGRLKSELVHALEPRAQAVGLRSGDCFNPGGKTTSGCQTPATTERSLERSTSRLPPGP